MSMLLYYKELNVKMLKDFGYDADDNNNIVSNPDIKFEIAHDR